MEFEDEEDGGITLEEMLLIQDLLLEDIECGYETTNHNEQGLSDVQTPSSNTFNDNNNESKKKKPELTLQQRAKIITKLLVSCQDNGKLPWGVQGKIANQFGVDKSTISRIWAIANEQKNEHGYVDAHSKKIGNRGRKEKEYDEEWLHSFPLHKRTTIRSFVRALHVSPTTVYGLLKSGKLRSHSSTTHPKLSDKHKIARLKWVLSQIIPSSWTESAVFYDMHNEVHIDEKWFILNPNKRKFYFLPREEDPYRCAQSKHHSVKVMFMAAIARPIINENGEVLWDGKIGIFPFTYETPAIRSIKNRERATLETKVNLSITKDVIRRMLIDQMLPTIKRLWPPFLSKDIVIQQDSARPHIQPDDPEFVQAAAKDGFNIRLICQPAQSPDLNVLDLSFFRAIQALEYQHFPKDVKDLAERVEEAYILYDPKIVNNGWLTLQYVMQRILQNMGGNNFRIPHVNKLKLERNGELPENVQVDQKDIDEAVKYLNEGIIGDQNPNDIGFDDVDMD